jgi:hypothetical protein
MTGEDGRCEVAGGQTSEKAKEAFLPLFISPQDTDLRDIVVVYPSQYVSLRLVKIVESSAQERASLKSARIDSSSGWFPLTRRPPFALRRLFDASLLVVFCPESRRNPIDKHHQ